MNYSLLQFKRAELEVIQLKESTDWINNLDGKDKDDTQDTPDCVLDNRAKPFDSENIPLLDLDRS